MYFKNCGKYIGNDNDICDECLKKQQENKVEQPVQVAQPVQQPVYTQQKPLPFNNSRMAGFGFGITALILGIIAEILITVGTTIIAEFIWLAYDYTREVLIAGLIPMIVGVCFGLPALVLGIVGINIFRSQKRAGCKAPVATLATSICGVVCSALNLILAFIIFIIILAVIGAVI